MQHSWAYYNCVQNFAENQNVRDRLGDLGLHRVTKIKCIVEGRPVAEQRPRDKQKYNSRYWVNKHVCRTTIENSMRGIMFSVRSVPRCYKQDRWSNELVVGRLPDCKNVSTEAEDIVGIRHQATTGEDTADWEDLRRTVVNCRVWISDGAMVICSYDL
jgi:hypothetical protein